MGIILFKYIAYKYLKVFLIFSLIILFIATFLEAFRMKTETDLSMLKLLSISIMRTPFVLNDVFIFVVFFTTMIVFKKLNSGRELDVIRAAGASFWNFVFPSLCAVFFLAVFTILIFHPISSHLMLKSNILEKELKGNTREVKELQNGSGLSLILPQDDGTLAILHSFFVEGGDSNKLINVSTVFIDDKGNFLSQYISRTATTDQTSVKFVPKIVKISGNQTVSSVGSFSIKANLSSSIAPFLISREPNMIPLLGLPYIIKLREESEDVSSYKIQFNRLLSLPLLWIALVILGVTFSLENSRKGFNIISLIFSIFIIFIIYFSFSLFNTFVLSGLLPAFLVNWGIAFSTLSYGILRVLYIGEDS